MIIGRLITWLIVVAIFLTGSVAGINIAILEPDVEYDAAAWKPVVALIAALVLGNTLGLREE